MNSFASFEPILIICLINVILTVGLYVNALSGVLQLCTAALAGISGYVAAVLTTNFGLPFLVSVMVGSLVAALNGVVLAVLTEKMEMFILKLTTLAFGEAVVVFTFNIDYLGGANSFTGISLETGLMSALVATALAIFIAWRVDGSHVGFAARSIRDDHIAAAAIGISLLRIRIITFALGAAIIGMGGALQAHYLLIVNPSELGFFVSLTYIIFLVVGGIQTLWGPILAAVVLTLMPESIRFAGEYRMILYGFIVVVTVLVRPTGMISRNQLVRNDFSINGKKDKTSRLSADV